MNNLDAFCIAASQAFLTCWDAERKQAFELAEELRVLSFQRTQVGIVGFAALAILAINLGAIAMKSGAVSEKPQ